MFIFNSIGIPHPKGPFYFDDEMRLTMDDLTTNQTIRLIRWIDQPNLYSVPTDLVGKKFYRFKNLITGQVWFSRYVSYDIIKAIMKQEGFYFFTLFFFTKRKLIMFSSSSSSLSWSSNSSVMRHSSFFDFLGLKIF